MKDELGSLLDSLSWECSEEEQNEAIEKLIPHKHHLFKSLITNTGKKQWDSAIRLVGKLKYIDQVQMIPQLLFLLKDMNWPGAQAAVNIMSKMDRFDLEPFIIDALITANRENDSVWIAWLKSFIKDIGMENLIVSHQEIFEKSEW